MDANPALTADSGRMELGIVVPAFRGRFLARTLESLARQTDRRFRVVVADDGSEEDLASIVAPFHGRIDLTYHRFAENRGGQSLVGHWHRALALAETDWLWLLSDDDEAEPECVAAFHATRAAHPDVDLFRFNLDLIDAEDRVYHRPEPHPDFEDGVAHALAIVGERRREWRVSDHVFSRAIHAARGGFPDFPLALFSDYAGWMEFGTPRGVRTIPGARVRWRHHHEGVSSGFGQHHRGAMLAALAAYSRWLHAYAARLGPAEEARFGAVARAHLFHLVGLIDPVPNGREQAALLGSFRAAWGGSGWRLRRDLLRASLKSYLRAKPGFRLLASWRFRRSFPPVP